MSDLKAMNLVVGADISGVTKGMQDARKELTATAAAAQKLDSSLGGIKPGANQATSAMTNLGRVIQDAPYGIIGITNNINPLLESFQRLKVETGSTKAALSSLGSSLLGGGGLGLAVSVVTSLMTVFAMNALSKTGDEAEKAGKKVKTYSEILDGIVSSIGREVSETAGLIAILKNETETRERKLSAIKELQAIQPEIFGNIKLEKDAVIGLDAAYVAYMANLKSVIAAKIIQANIETKITELLKLQGAENTKQQQQQLDTLKNLINSNSTLSEIKKNLQDTKLGGGFLTDKQTSARIAQLNSELKGLFENLTELSKGIKVAELKVKVEKVKVEADKMQMSGLKPQSGVQDIPVLKLKPQILVAPDIKFINTDAIGKKILENIQGLINAEKIGEILSNTINEGMSAAAEGFANILSGTANGLDGLFSGLANVLGNGLKLIGQYLVKTYLLIGVIEKIKFSNPAVGVAVGFALQVLGALVKTKLSKTPAFATGVRGFGGGPALVGERGPELVQLPRGSNVQTNGQLNAMRGNDWGGNVTFEIDGMKLRGVLQKTNNYAGRNGF